MSKYALAAVILALFAAICEATVLFDQYNERVNNDEVWDGPKASDCNGNKAFVVVSWFGDKVFNSSLPSCSSGKCPQADFTGAIFSFKNPALGTTTDADYYYSNIQNNLKNYSFCLEPTSNITRVYLIRLNYAGQSLNINRCSPTEALCGFTINVNRQSLVDVSWEFINPASVIERNAQNWRFDYVTQPTAAPSQTPTLNPSAAPSTKPSTNPSAYPSMMPSTNPSTKPSTNPSANPSAYPSVSPTVSPPTHRKTFCGDKTAFEVDIVADKPNEVSWQLFRQETLQVEAFGSGTPIKLCLNKQIYCGLYWFQIYDGQNNSNVLGTTSWGYDLRVDKVLVDSVRNINHSHAFRFNLTCEYSAPVEWDPGCSWPFRRVDVVINSQRETPLVWNIINVNDPSKNIIEKGNKSRGYAFCLDCGSYNFEIVDAGPYGFTHGYNDPGAYAVLGDFRTIKVGGVWQFRDWVNITFPCTAPSASPTANPSSSPTGVPSRNPTAHPINSPSANPSAAPTPVDCDTGDYRIKVELNLVGPDTTRVYNWEFLNLTSNNTAVYSSAAVNKGVPNDQDYLFSEFCVPCGEYFYSIIDYGAALNPSSGSQVVLSVNNTATVNTTSTLALNYFTTGKFFKFSCVSLF
jgi:hypothetical protein